MQKLSVHLQEHLLAFITSIYFIDSLPTWIKAMKENDISSLKLATFCVSLWSKKLIEASRGSIAGFQEAWGEPCSAGLAKASCGANRAKRVAVKYAKI
jgi:hypothetical protein